MPSSIINSDDGVISGTSGLKSTGGDDGVLILQTKGTAAVTVDGGQRTKFPTTIGVGGATPSTSGSGISFPATQSASSDANTLDDYEEGTWTPTISAQFGTLGSATFTSGVYTKVSRLVTISGEVTITNVGSGSGALILSLPFSAASANFSGSGAETSVVGYQCATFGEGSALHIRKYDFTTVMVLNHKIRFSASYIV